jgi:hypothetical protein
MLSGNTAPIRDFGHTQIYDPYSALEDPSSPEWAAAVAEENALWASTPKPDARKWEARIRHFYERALPLRTFYAHETFTTPHHGNITIQYGYGHRINVWIGTKVYTGLSAFHYDPESDLYATIADVGHGGEQCRLSVYSVRKPDTPRWTRDNVGPSALFFGTHVYYQTVENRLRYPGICYANKHTGHRAATLFHEDDPRVQVELSCRNNTPFVRIHNALSQRLGVIKDQKIRWLTPARKMNGRGTTLVPIHANAYATNNSVVIHDRAHPLPSGAGYVVDALFVTDRYLVTTVARGCMSLYVLDSGHYTLLYTSTTPNEIRMYASAPTTPVIELTYPHKSAVLHAYASSPHPHLVYKRTFPEPLRLRHAYTGLAKNAADGTRVPYTCVSAVARPNKLIVAAYGAYGISAQRSYPIRWLAWLERGYALVVAMPRGGRDDGDAWYDQARGATRKHRTFEDNTAVVYEAQKRFHIPPAQTLLYGRSAGGFAAAYVGTHEARRFGAVYAEVPYVDVLRTSSNPALPLTQLEYDEFGHPMKRRADFDALLKLSPVDTVSAAPHGGTPCILVRTAVHDAQVLAYEAVKWAKKLRAHGWYVRTGIDANGGHFTAYADMYTIQAEDAAILDQCLTPSGRRTRKARSHTSKGTRRRRISS